MDVDKENLAPSSGMVWVQLAQGGGMGGANHAHKVQVPLSALAAMREAVQRGFSPHLDGKEFMLTNTVRDIQSDKDLADVKPGELLLVVFPGDRSLIQPVKERISFMPHPKTMTMAGDYEYFASQGKHPLVYALAELVDNALRAMRMAGERSDGAHSVTVSILLGATAHSSAICVHDTGVGMTKQELNQWAVMNLSMEDRGQRPTEPPHTGCSQVQAKTAPTCFLTSDISFFGVGSKNACFYLGGSTKVVTKTCSSPYVHELTIAAEALESRYKLHEGGDVWQEELVHRNVNDASTLLPHEAPHAHLVQSVAAERPDQSFTRVLVTCIKEKVFEHLQSADENSVCCELAHIYHYYLHGPSGNRADATSDVQDHASVANCSQTTAASRKLPPDSASLRGPLPDLVVQKFDCGHLVWRSNLKDVTVDLETQYLRAQRAEFRFTLAVPSRGNVEGVIFYYPYNMDAETVPDDSGLAKAAMALPGMPEGLTQDADQDGMGEDSGGETAGATAMPSTVPMFEAFWQGRLIPETRVHSVPFVRKVMAAPSDAARRSAQARDVLPDECFARLRGMLFFGPSFRVTRNKLSFRDDLHTLLEAAAPLERNLDRKFREWLVTCHSTLDKYVVLKTLAPAAEQAAMRREHGERITLFKQADVGSFVISAGDTVKLKFQGGTVARVLYFSVAEAVKQEGAYARGSVWVQPLPEELHGPTKLAVPLRRLEGPASADELQQHVERERRKAPSCLRVTPMWFSSGKSLTLEAGSAIAATSVAVMSGGSNKPLRSYVLAGVRTSLTVVQTLRYHPHPEADAAGDAADAAAAVAASTAKSRRRGRHNPDGSGGSARGDAIGSDEGEVVLCVRNPTPIQNSFQFEPLCNGLKHAGRYSLELSVEQLPHVKVTCDIRVRAGALAGVALDSPPAQLSARLGGPLGPDLRLLLLDAFQNVMESVKEAPAISFDLQCAATGEPLHACAVVPRGGCFQVDGGALQLSGLQLELRDLAAAGDNPHLPFTTAAATAAAAAAAATAAATKGRRGPGSGSQQGRNPMVDMVTAELRVRVAQLKTAQPLSVPLCIRPGLPATLAALPGHPFEGGAADTAAGMAVVMAGTTLPPMWVVAYDRWGFRTLPCEHVPYVLTVRRRSADGDALDDPGDDELTVEFDENGIACVDHLEAPSTMSGTLEVVLELQHLDEDAAATMPARAAADTSMATAPPQLVVHVMVHPSTAPDHLVLLRDGEMVAVGASADAADADAAAAPDSVIEGLEVGSMLTGLSVKLVMHEGQDALGVTSGKLSTSWTTGSKKVSLGPDPLPLPRNVPVGHNCDEDQVHWVRLQCAHVAFELSFVVRASAGPPYSWGLSVLEDDHKGERLTQATRHTEDSSQACGQPFFVEIEVLDRFANPCSTASVLALGREEDGARDAGGIVMPSITPQLELLDMDRPLRLCCEGGAWEHNVERDRLMYRTRVRIDGTPGDSLLCACDAAAADGESLLDPDSLKVELKAGRAATLCFTTQAIQCGLRAELQDLCVAVHDRCGNLASGVAAGTEVTLEPTAACQQPGVAAAKLDTPAGSASGGAIKQRLVDGTATFAGVRVKAKHEGVYTARAVCSSRKLALEPALLQLTVTLSNAITSVELSIMTVDGEEITPQPTSDIAAGATVLLSATLSAEDGRPVRGVDVARAVVLRAEPPPDSGLEPILMSPSQVEDSGLDSGDQVLFAMPPLEAVGTYRMLAEYTELRDGVQARPARHKDRAKSKANACSSTRCSAPLELVVRPAAAAGFRLLSHGPANKRLTASNDSAASRVLLSDVMLQLIDRFDNAVAQAGVEVHVRLCAAGDCPDDQVPALAPAAVGSITDEHGRAMLGSISILQQANPTRAAAAGQSTQAAVRAAGTGSCECRLLLEATGLRSLEFSVVYTDDQKRLEALQRLNQRHAALLERRQQLERRSEKSEEQLREAHAAREQARGSLQAVRKRGEESLTAAAALQRLRALESEAPDEPPTWPAKLGRPGTGASVSLQTMLSSGDAQVVGAVPNLGTLLEPELARILAWLVGAKMMTVVVKSGAFATAAVQHLRSLPNNQRGSLCHFLALDLIAACPYPDAPVPDSPAGTHRNDPVDAFRSRCLYAAAHATDPPLHLPLPHHKPLPEGAPVDATLWLSPPGFIGPAVNLIRPTVLGQRRSVWWSLLGQTLLFDTGAHAVQYRKICTQVVKTSCPNIVALDGSKLMGNGFVTGDAPPPPLERLDAVFGSVPPSETPQMLGRDQERRRLQRLVEALNELESAQAAVAQAEEANHGSEELNAELAEVSAQMDQVDAQLAILQLRGTRGADDDDEIDDQTQSPPRILKPPRTKSHQKKTRKEAPKGEQTTPKQKKRRK